MSPAFPLSIDGSIVPAIEARISALDQAFTQGLGAFDTLLVRDGRAHFRERHLERLSRTCAYLSIDTPSLHSLPTWLDAYLQRLPPSPLALRTTITRGSPNSPPTVVIAARTFDPIPPAGAVLTIEQRFRLSGDALDQHKTSSRARHALARESAQQQGAFDALLRHADGDVADATSANLFALIDNDLITPPIERGALPGITRAVLLEELRRTGTTVHERPLPISDLQRADEIFLTNSLHRIIPVRAILGLVDTKPGAAARHALELITHANP